MNLSAESPPLTATVDWMAVLWAGLLAGVLSLLLYLFFVPAAVGAGNAAAVLRYIASVLLGAEVLPPPPTLTVTVVAVALLVHFAFALFMTLVIAQVLHRWGLLVGIIGGALFGLVFFLINFYTLTWIRPELFAMAHWSVVLVHVAFGATAGGVYELLETEPGERRPGV